MAEENAKKEAGARRGSQEILLVGSKVKALIKKGGRRRNEIAGLLLGCLLLACHPAREVPVRLVDRLAAPAPPAAEAELAAWTFAMRVWPYDEDVQESLGEDESGREIEVLLGAEAMETWNIRVDPKARSLDLSRFRTEFVEY